MKEVAKTLNPHHQERNLHRPSPSWSHRQGERGSIWTHSRAVPRERRHIFRHFQRFLSLGHTLLLHIVLPAISFQILLSSCPTLPFHRTAARTLYLPNPRVNLCARPRGNGVAHIAPIYRTAGTCLFCRVPRSDEQYYMRATPYWRAAGCIDRIAGRT